MTMLHFTVDIEYNLLNLPHTVSENSTVKATYKYLADGTKASAIGNNGDYIEKLKKTNVKLKNCKL